jgi:hypothetical protein
MTQDLLNFFGEIDGTLCCLTSETISSDIFIFASQAVHKAFQRAAMWYWLKQTLVEKPATTMTTGTSGHIDTSHDEYGYRFFLGLFLFFL